MRQCCGVLVQTDIAQTPHDREVASHVSGTDDIEASVSQERENLLAIVKVIGIA